ncbi:immunoglobulin superfamily member 1-like [Malaclemys terrapin pileata]|uniref:immunoglobulin superfamily member 1-like n=1 Tax=Malaclemys terrapin pileata TaxID=2991368 RepID=UPI0023A8FA19|nr:immunoglobulin superfamily member 1-like [Malaclemys terrapin pileata]
MASALTVLFLSCWLAGHSGVWGGHEFLKPTVWVSPSRVVALGGNVTICCEGLYPGMEFFLRKTGQLNPQRQPVPDGTVAEFPIASVGREDGGSYTCDYRSITEQNRTSHPSDSVEIIVGEPNYTKPTISMTPSKEVPLGRSVSVWCQGQGQGVKIVLNKDGRYFSPVDSDGSKVVFSVSNVSREEGGSYSCSYYSKLEPFAVSYPSDPVELVVRDPNLPRPSISLSPTGVTAPGADVTIRCQGQRWDVRFFLHKAGDLNPPRHMDPAGAGAEFRIPTVGLQHKGKYNCNYRLQSQPFVSSEPSDSVELVVADPSLPRPSISLSPTGVTAPGADVTIRCQGQRRNVTFFLHKPGGLNPQQHMDPAGDGAEFGIPTVGRQHGGNYTCSYRLRSEPFISSEPSDPMQLVVAEPTLPKPIISPSGEVSLGGAVSVQCWGQGPGVRIVLNKGGRHVAHVDSEKLKFLFPINNVRREQGGNYSCSHHSRSEPFVRWSESVELVVRDPNLPRPSISLSPTGVTAPGADVTIRCQGQRQNVTFFLHKAEDPSLQQHMDPAGDGAEFHISTVGRQHGGNYSCSYRPRSEPFISSQPSDSVQLVVAG